MKAEFYRLAGNIRLACQARLDIPVKRLVVTGLILGMALSLGFASPVTAADTQDIICQWVPGNDCVDASAQTPKDIAEKITDVLTFFIGAISVIVIVIAGFMYVTSAGSPDKTRRAKDAILYALVGIAVAVFAQVIVRFVINSL